MSISVLRCYIDHRGSHFEGVIVFALNPHLTLVDIGNTLARRWFKLRTQVWCSEKADKHSKIDVSPYHTTSQSGYM